MNLCFSSINHKPCSRGCNPLKVSRDRDVPKGESGTHFSAPSITDPLVNFRPVRENKVTANVSRTRLDLPLFFINQTFPLELGLVSCETSNDGLSSRHSGRGWSSNHAIKRSTAESAGYVKFPH